MLFCSPLLGSERVLNPCRPGHNSVTIHPAHRYNELTQFSGILSIFSFQVLVSQGNLIVKVASACNAQTFRRSTYTTRVLRRALYL